ncbi:MAG: HAMP domain-containing sensor histidine kinase [Pseudomonadota bacterium]
MKPGFDRFAALECLTVAIQALSRARTISEVSEIVRRAARTLSGADGATFVLRDGELCHYVDEDAIAPLWKGQRFPMEACVSGWVMRHARAITIEDIYADPRIPADAYRPTFVKSLAMTPIRRTDPIGAIGAYWAAQSTPSREEVDALQTLADSTSIALENVRLYGELQDKIVILSHREARLREQRDTLDVFARSLAHDLKEPAHTIHSFAQLLAQHPLPDMAQRHLQFINDAGARMAMLVNVVFDYTRIDPDQLNKSNFSLNDAADEAVSALANFIAERGASIRTTRLPAVCADRDLVVRVLQSLIHNAIAHSTTPVDILIEGAESEDVARVYVSDNGPGVDSDQRDKIFTPFHRLNRDGAYSGMGLALCRKIIAFHGGKIECAPAPSGQGAVFSFSLPKTSSNAQPRGQVMSLVHAA